jgi:hypothetical protein
MFQGRRASLAMRLRRVRFSSGPHSMRRRPAAGQRSHKPSGSGSSPLVATTETWRSDNALPSGGRVAGSIPAVSTMRAEPERQGVRLLIGCVRVRAPGRAPMFIDDDAIVTQDRAFTASRAIRRRRRGATCATLRVAMVRDRSSSPCLAPVAKRKSSGLRSRKPGVQISPGAPHSLVV